MDGFLESINQVPLSPRDHYRHLRSLWVFSCRKSVDLSKSSFFSLLSHPFVQDFEPSVALVRLLLSEDSKFYETPSLWSHLSRFANAKKMPLLSEWIQCALFYLIKADQAVQENLLKDLFPLLSHPTLWAREELYNPQEFTRSLLMLCRSGPDLVNFEARKYEMSPNANFRKAGLVALDDLFFSQLAKTLPDSPFQGFSQHSFFKYMPIGLWVHPSSAVCLSGSGTSLGIFKGAGVEISACGPQLYPLTSIELFGVQGVHSAQSIDEEHICGWTSCFGQNELWLQAAVTLLDLGWKIDLKWAGILPEKKVAFVFYVKAKSAHIGAQSFYSKSLQRFRTKAKAVHFNEGNFTIECLEERDVEIIPLAGEGCFWDADFLVAFEIKPFDVTRSFVCCFKSEG